jgi:hypothetical protein
VSAQTAGRYPILVDPANLFIRHRDPLAVADTVYHHNVVIALDSQGRAAKATGTSGLKIVGFYDGETFTAASTDRVSVANGVIPMVNSSTDPVTIADLKNVVYLEDEQTIARTSAGGTLSPCGVLELFEDSTPKVQIGAVPPVVLSESMGYIAIPLTSWREVNSTGDVGNIAANGGVLASDTTPVYDAVATSNEHEILWATGNVDPIGVSVALPRDFDGSGDATLDLEVASGTTDAATIVCASSWSAGAAGTEASDSTSDTATKSATPHRISITIAAADIPDASRRVTFRLTPPTHATDTISLFATGLAYKRKP